MPRLLLLFSSLLVFAVSLASSVGLAQGQKTDQCSLWFDFSTFGITDMTINGALTHSELQLNAALIYRPLLTGDDYYWLGLQLYNPSLTVDSEDALEPLYSIPFAIKLDKQENRIQSYVFNAPLKDADKSKLTTIYQALHISKPDKGESLQKYITQGQDDLGIFEEQYEHSKNAVQKSKLGYTQIGQQVSDNIIASIRQIDIKKDQTQFVTNDCWLSSAEGNSNLEVISENDFLNIRVLQQMDLFQKSGALPLDARLLSLPLDPTQWEMLPEEYVYPKPERQPENTGDDFLRKLATLDFASMSSEAILQFLYNNDEYLPLLKGPLWSSNYDNEFEKRLFLMIGKTDSANAHWLLTEIYTDESFNGDARFRSLMALKYAENPIDAGLVDQIIQYSLQPLSGEHAELAHSALMVMGIVAKNQLEQDFGHGLSNRLATELRSNSSAKQSAALLTALGNTGDVQHQDLVETYLDHSHATLRQRSAEALSQLPGQQSLLALSNRLSSETNKRVQSAMLKGMGANTLDGNQLNQVYSFAKESGETEVRHAAIKALSQQVSGNPEVKNQLKQLTKTERNRGNLQEILRAVYSNGQ